MCVWYSLGQVLWSDALHLLSPSTPRQTHFSPRWQTAEAIKTTVAWATEAIVSYKQSVKCALSLASLIKKELQKMTINFMVCLSVHSCGYVCVVCTNAYVLVCLCVYVYVQICVDVCWGNSSALGVISQGTHTFCFWDRTLMLFARNSQIQLG